MTEPTPSPGSQPPDDRQSSSRQPRVWQSVEILQGAELVLIEHQGKVYQLRVTRQNKLVLNK